MEMLRDGKGNGYLAGVNRYHQLETKTISLSEEQFVSVNEKSAYFLNSTQTADTLAITATGGNILHLQNLSTTQLLYIHKIIISNSTAGTILKWIRNATVGTIGNNNTVVPVNSNFSSSNTANVNAYSWNQVGDGMTGITGGSVGVSFILGVGVLVLPLDGVLVLGVGNSITLAAKGVTNLSLGIRFYHEEI